MAPCVFDRFVCVHNRSFKITIELLKIPCNNKFFNDGKTSINAIWSKKIKYLFHIVVCVARRVLRTGPMVLILMEIRNVCFFCWKNQPIIKTHSTILLFYLTEYRNNVMEIRHRFGLSLYNEKTLNGVFIGYPYIIQKRHGPIYNYLIEEL